MRVLIIDNYSRHLDAIRAGLDCAADTVSCEKLDEVDTAKYDGFILSGSSVLGAQRNRDGRYAKELKLITETEKPLLGICVGMQLLCLAHGGSLQRDEEKTLGERKVRVVAENELLCKGEHAFIHAHHWHVVDAGELETLSIDNQVVKDPKKPHYGVLFHPEVSGEAGSALFKRFLKQVRSQ